MIKKINLFQGVPDELIEERFDTLVDGVDLRIERIVSRGHRSPEGFWYDQDKSEWVILLSGCAALEFEGQYGLIEMHPGDAIDIPAHRRHRVKWTSATESTVWLAVHYRSADKG